MFFHFGNRFALHHIALFAIIVGSASTSSQAIESAGVPLPVIGQAKGEQCVEPAALMRRYHMVFLSHQRDATVHKGVRAKRHSLAGCIECHAQTDAAGQPVRIDAKGQFCESCHSYAAVSIDCFSCHAAKPAHPPMRTGAMSADEVVCEAAHWLKALDLTTGHRR